MIEEEYNNEDDTETYRLTEAGFHRILGWMRFQNQLCEMEHGNNEVVCEDETHNIAFMMVFVLFPMMEALGIAWDEEQEVDPDAPWLEECPHESPE